MLKIDINKCTGCGACIQKCPQKCINWKEGELGFLYPEINKDLCINCDLCVITCPIEKDLRLPSNQNIFAVVHKNKKILTESTSGGAFSAIAHYILGLNGFVYGCHMDSDFKVAHSRIDKLEELGKLRGSKYVQSNLKDTFIQTENDLKNGFYVLYTGTPCQIAGLYQYLGKYYEKLVTMDIVCHGVGSQAYFDKYINYAKKRYGNIKELCFRSKKIAGWSCGGGHVIVINNKKRHKIKKFYNYNNYYYYYFLNSDIFRRSCYECPYTNTIRQGDFTVGDFWGVESYDLNIDTKEGCSLLFINNSNAQKILNNISDLHMIKVTLAQAVRSNEQLKHPSDTPAMREELMKQYEALTAIEMQKLFIKNNTKAIIKEFVKSLVPYRVKLIIRRWR